MPASRSGWLLVLAVWYCGAWFGSWAVALGVSRWSLVAVVVMTLALWLNEDGWWGAVCDRMGVRNDSIAD